MPSLRASCRAAVLVLVSAMTGGCMVHEHVVGTGPNNLGTSSSRQFYVLFGLFQLNEADSQRLTHGLNAYRITTEVGFVDAILLPLLLPLTVTSRTVTVER